MQPLEAIIVGGIIAIATGFLLWTFWPSTGKRKNEEGNRSACASKSCGCAGKELAVPTDTDRERATRSSASTVSG